MKRANIGALLLSALLAAGCSGRELLAGGQTEAQAAATDHAGAGSASTAPAGPRLSTAPAAAPTGTLEVTASVALLDEEGRAVPVTDGFAAVQLRIAEADTVPFDDPETIRTGTYPVARVAFSRVAATVTGGVLVGGVPLLGEVEVTIGSTPLVVEAPVQVVAREGEPVLVVVDLNAAAWLAATDPVTRQVPAGALAAAVEVSAR